MQTTSEKDLQELAARVARRVATGRPAASALPAALTLLVLSGEGAGLAAVSARLSAASEPVYAVPDCWASAAGALAGARARIPSLVIPHGGDDAIDVDALVARASRVLAPSMDLALASRVASLQADSPGARAIHRALLAGVPVEASLSERDFRASERAPEGVRRALGDVEARLRALGVTISEAAASASARAGARPAASGVSTVGSVSPSAAYGAGREHPSRERFAFPDSVGEFVEFLEHKPCSLEPGKPCVDCGACEARGF